MPTIIIASAARPEALQDVEATLAQVAGFAVRLRAPGLVVMSDADPELSLHGASGVVFGDFFSRADLRRIRILSSNAATAMTATGGRVLISDYWGDYLAVLLGPDGRARVVRSPFGALSLYRFKLHDVEFFTSDVGVLLDAGWLTPRIDWDFVAHYLAYPFQRTRRTGFVGVSEAPAGSVLTLAPGQCAEEEVVWSPWDHTLAATEPHPADRLRDLTRRCVRAWADGRQKLLLELSGGLDSSILAACLWDVTADVVCVNMVSSARDGDERLFARAAAQKTGLELEEIELRPAELTLTAPPSLRRPRPGAHALLETWDLALIGRARDLGAEAFMSGGGGDNVFFNTHGSAPAADALRRGAISRWAAAVQDLSRLHGCSIWQAAAMSIKRALAPVQKTWRPDVRFLQAAACPAIPEPHPWLVAGPGALPGKVDHVKALMSVQNYLDCFPRSAQAPILTPLLSQPLVEYCLSVPSWEWIRNGQDRALAREAFRDKLPELVLERRSKGSLAGFAGPAFEAARDQLADHLLGGELDKAGLLDGAALRAALEEIGPPKGSDYFRIMQIADVESWARRWR